MERDGRHPAQPFNVTVAPDGTLYIVDTDHSMIRQVKDGKI